MTMLNDGEKHITPIKAIRLKCLDCCCDSTSEVAECPCTDCSLWPFRFGKNPNVRLSDEERERRRHMARENLSFTQHIKSTEIIGAADGRENGDRHDD